MIHALTIYGFTFLLLCTLQFLSYLLCRTRNVPSKLFLQINIPVAVLLLSVVFNMSYTGYYGWNLTPETKMELLLDTITSIIMIGAGTYHAYYSFKAGKLPKKDEAQASSL